MVKLLTTFSCPGLEIGFKSHNRSWGIAIQVLTKSRILKESVDRSGSCEILGLPLTSIYLGAHVYRKGNQFDWLQFRPKTSLSVSVLFNAHPTLTDGTSVRHTGHMQWCQAECPDLDGVLRSDDGVSGRKPFRLNPTQLSPTYTLGNWFIDVLEWRCHCVIVTQSSVLISKDPSMRLISYCLSSDPDNQCWHCQQHSQLVLNKWKVEYNKVMATL